MRLQPGVAAREDAAAGSEKAENRDTLKYLEYVYCNVLFSSGLSFGHFYENSKRKKSQTQSEKKLKLKNFPQKTGV